MRIWLGVEKEGKNIGAKTIFIEKWGELLVNELRVASKLARQYNATSLYLGAGEVFTYLSNDCLEFIRESNLYTTYEIKQGDLLYSEDLPNVIEAVDNVVLSIPVNFDSNKLEIKLRGLSSVNLLTVSESVITYINEVEGGIYKDDKILYNEGELA